MSTHASALLFTEEEVEGILGSNRNLPQSMNGWQYTPPAEAAAHRASGRACRPQWPQASQPDCPYPLGVVAPSEVGERVQESAGEPGITMQPNSIIALDRFIQATRDSGYKSTVSAVSELVDNAIQAEAGHVQVHVLKTGEIPDHPMLVATLDEGHGMYRATLRQALRFGGSSRFGDRSSLGRYGMGLPNASLSQARFVEVYSWTDGGKPLYTYLDVDEVAQGNMTEVPTPRKEQLPPWVSGASEHSGTLVIWRWCDRLDNKRISTLERKLQTSLGRVFRYFLWDNVRISINGTSVQPADPLYLQEPSRTSGGAPFGEPLNYEVRTRARNGESEEIGTVTIRFAELPVHRWHSLPKEEKRAMGLSNGAGVSVVRAGREIDYGWFFLHGKRRENYDDWWRAEISFDPELDELFGMTHTKQQIKPHESLVELLGPDMVETARALNARVRQAHVALRARTHAEGAEDIARGREEELRPLPRRKVAPSHRAARERLQSRHPSLAEDHPTDEMTYTIVEDDLADSQFFRPVIEPNRVTIAVNPHHRFYKELYRPAVEDAVHDRGRLGQLMQLLLLAAARAEAAASPAEQRVIRKFREEWSEVLSVLFKR